MAISFFKISNLDKGLIAIKLLVFIYILVFFFLADLTVSKAFADGNQGAEKLQRVIHAAGTRSLPPYCYLDKNGEPTGFLIDVLKVIAEKEDLHIDIELHSSERLSHFSSKGHCDLYLGVTFEEAEETILPKFSRFIDTTVSDFDLEKYQKNVLNQVSGKELYNYSFFLPLFEIEYSYFQVGKKAPVIRNLKDREIMAEKSSNSHRYLMMIGMVDNIVPVDSPGAALYGIVSEEADYALMERFYGEYLIDKLELRNISRIEQALFVEDTGIVVTNGNFTLLASLKNGLKEIESTGILEELYDKWFGQYSQPVFNTSYFIRIISVSGIIIILSLLTNFYLKRKVSRIAQERERIIDFTRDGIVAVDKDGKISLLNRTAIELLGLKGNEKGERVEEHVPELRLDEILKNGKAVNDFEQNINGKIFVTNKAPVRIKDEIIGAIATFRDTTEIRAMAQEITGVKMYVESLRVQNHEFLNKLQAISGLIQLGKTDRAIQFISSEQQEWQSITSFVSEHIENFVVGGILVGKIGKCRELGIGFSMDPDSSCRENTSVGDQVLVTVIGNLFENSIESLKNNKIVDPRIEFAVFDESNQIMISVRDNGMGIRKEIMEKIFEKGFSTRQCGKSCGYGLYNIRMMVEALKGDIAFNSIPGDYTEFIVTLPNWG